jgi:hypothetical protein
MNSSLEVAPQIYEPPTSTEAAWVPTYFGSKSEEIQERKRRRLLRYIYYFLSHYNMATHFDHQEAIFKSLKYIKLNYKPKLILVWVDWGLSQYVSVSNVHKSAKPTTKH